MMAPKRSPGTVTASDTALWEALLQSAIEKNACEVPVTWGDFGQYVTNQMKCQEIGAFLHRKKKTNCKLPAFVGGLHRQFHVISFIQTFKRIPWEQIREIREIHESWRKTTGESQLHMVGMFPFNCLRGGINHFPTLIATLNFE